MLCQCDENVDSFVKACVVRDSVSVQLQSTIISSKIYLYLRIFYPKCARLCSFGRRRKLAPLPSSRGSE